jgi:hypothetical protein
MALIACPECGQQVSTLAETCPHCGVAKPAAVAAQRVPPPRRLVPTWVIVFSVVIGFIGIMILVNSGGQDESKRAPLIEQNLHERAIAASAISAAGHPCGTVTSAARTPSGGIRAVCSNGDTYRIVEVQGKTLAMRCSAVKAIGVEGC